MTNENNETTTRFTRDVRAISSIVQSPTAVVLLLMVLGGQGADLFASNNYSVELRELSADVQLALTGITDNSDRIDRLEMRIDNFEDRRDDMESELRELRSKVDRFEIDRER